MRDAHSQEEYSDAPHGQVPKLVADAVMVAPAGGRYASEGGRKGESARDGKTGRYPFLTHREMSGYKERLIQLWNDWQLIAAVVLSHSLQVLLLVTACFRRRNPASWWSEKYFWVHYIVSSFIASYSLGILSRASTANADADIQAFWAALLLFHLGGVDDFTALSLEDNKLWDRRCFTLAVQVAITAYVFFRYFKDDAFKGFIGPFWLIFVAELLKCAEQVLALRQATMEALIKSVLGIPDPGPDYADTMDRVDGMLRSGVLPSLNIDNERIDGENSDDLPVNDEVEAYDTEDPQQAVRVIRSAHCLFSRFKVLFADGIFSFEDRRESRAEFSNKGKDWAFKVVEIELSFVYDRLYTKASVSRTTRGLLIRVASLLLILGGTFRALILLRDDDKYSGKNKTVSLLLFAGAATTEFFILGTHILSVWSVVHSEWLRRWACRLANESRWSGHMAQSNLITFCLQKLPSEHILVASISERLLSHVTRDAGRMNRLPPGAHATFSFARKLQASVGFPYFRRSVLEQIRSGSSWDKYADTNHVPVGDELKAFIFQELRKKERLSIERERKRNRGPPEDDRGGQALESENVTGLEWSVQDKEFDESLLIWHIATDLCYRQEVNQTDPDWIPRETWKHMKIARELSNYLLYIMVVHPLMLSPSTTMATKRCRDTCAEARLLFLKEHQQCQTGAASDRGQAAGGVNQKNAHQLLLKVETPLPSAVVKGDRSKSVLWDGCHLARELTLTMADPGRKWRVVCRVWVEMLCYAAVHCGGYQHAERLKEGGELLTHVCLLMTHLGMSPHYRTEVGHAYARPSAFPV
ncbi:hypothetical protein ACP70R_043627 [Stipagrostis hirtigluma subsp. patula]